MYVEGQMEQLQHGLLPLKERVRNRRLIWHGYGEGQNSCEGYVR